MCCGTIHGLFLHFEITTNQDRRFYLFVHSQMFFRRVCFFGCFSLCGAHFSKFLLLLSSIIYSKYKTKYKKNARLFGAQLFRNIDFVILNLHAPLLADQKD